MKRLSVFVVLICFVCICRATDFISVDGSHLYRDASGRPYYFIGANFWYGAWIAADEDSVTRNNMSAELDALRSLGVDNLRIALFPELPDDTVVSGFTIERFADRQNREKLLTGLDLLLMELDKRDMVATFCFVSPLDLYPELVGGWCSSAMTGDAGGERDEFERQKAFSMHFLQCKDCQDKYFRYIDSIICRTNIYNNQYYKASSTVLSWQIDDGLALFGRDGEQLYWAWINRLAAYIKRQDGNHLLSFGLGRTQMDETSVSICERLVTNLHIDYVSFSLFPLEWDWASRSNLWTSLPNTYLQSNAYIDSFERLAQKYDKPLVLEAFGFPRDRSYFLPFTPTSSRDAFYNFIISHVVKNEQSQGVLAGCYFWGWAGSGRPSRNGKQVEKKYPADCRKDSQGLYSVYDADSTTISCIRRGVRQVLSDR